MSTPKRFFIALIQIYQAAVSPLLGSRCRFYPSCSEFAREAIEKQGARKGLYLAARRIFRCRPFGGSGFDPVP